MKLVASITTSAAIVTSFWGLALAQTVAATDASVATQESVAAAKLPTQIKTQVSIKEIEQIKKVPSSQSSGLVNFQQVAITGISQRVSLNYMASLWQAFDNEKQLHSRLIKKPKKIYVYYRNFSKDYQQADVSIGYLANYVSPVTSVERIDSGSYQTLLTKGHYSDLELTRVWKKIDFRNKVNSVVEVHYLGEHSNPIATEVMVNYL